MTTGSTLHKAAASRGGPSATPPGERPLPPPSLAVRVLAATAHLLMLASVPGIVLTVILWLACRRVPFVSQHARRALITELLAHLVLGILLAGALLAALTSTGRTIAYAGGAPDHSLLTLLAALGALTLLPLAALLCFLGVALGGALSALRGRTSLWASR